MISDRVREWAAAIFVPLMFLAAWWSVSTVNQRNDAAQQRVICSIEQQNRLQLIALRRVARELGIPNVVEVPEVSPPCVGVLP
jgi:hypothetical protein